MSPDAEGVCWSCGAKLVAVDYQREGECRQCRKQTHVCRNCRFYEPGRPNDCQEPIAEAVGNKLRANFCDYFEPSANAYRPAADADQLRAAADELFEALTGGHRTTGFLALLGNDTDLDQGKPRHRSQEFQR